MRSAVIACANGATLRESARKHNVPVTTLYCLQWKIGWHITIGPVLIA